ncbi:MAG: SusC/RagA family TonB-linked outer membrane protein [Bacteroidota bacterium]
MKITTFFMLISILTVSAASYAQKITLNERRASLEQLLDKVRQQSGYNIVYSDELLSKSHTVTLNLKEASLEDALKAILSDQALTYEIENKTIIIKEREVSLLDKAKALFAQVTITGKVTDETGQPLPGVTVKIKGTNQATATDQKGQYSLTVPDDKTIIAFSFIGYETQELAAKDIPNGSAINLKATETNLKEVIVSKGYYDEKRELLTGNVTTVSAKVIGEQPVSDPILALEGRVPGMYISQTSGMPGASYTIRLRGKNSISNGNDPLYIVDGVPYSSQSLISPFIQGGAVNGVNITPGQTVGGGLSPFNNLNPTDIESIEILKDADATAIYGSRGANGVILITTKKGKVGQTRVDVDVNSGEGHVAHTLQFLNTQQYLAMRHEAFKNDGIAAMPANNYDINGVWDTTRYTDWQKVLIGNTAHFTNANLSISGGNANTQFRLGGGYSKQTTVFPGEYDDQKASANINLNHTSTNQKFHALFTAQYVIDNNLLPQTDFTSFVADAPDAPAIYDTNGHINFQNGTFFNPISTTLQTALATTNNLVSSVNLDYELLTGLKLQSNFGYTHSEMNQTIQTPASTFYGPQLNNNRTNQIGTTSINTWIIEPQINYMRKISKGQLQLLIGGRVQEKVYNAIGYNTSGYTSDALIQNIQNASTISVAGNFYSDYRSNSVYGRLNYNWEDKYVINATASRDGSSRFGPANRFGNFGAVGAAWIFSKEKVIEDALPFLSFGKFRASYGTTGNDQIADYQYLSTYNTSGTYQNTSGLIPTRIASPYFAWEVVKKLEGGLELGFLKDRVMLNVDYYRNRTGNQLVGQPLPTQDGFTSIQANLPAIVQNTGIEAELTTENLKGKFNWTSSFNISVPRNKLVAFPGLASNSSYSNSYVVGKSIFSAPYYHYTGIDPQTGLYTFQDVNRDGVLSGADRLQFLKVITQDYFGGLANNFTYKNWQLNIFVQFVKQTGLKPLFVPGYYNSAPNVPTYLLDRWQNPGDQTDIPRFFTGGTALTAAGNAASSDYQITDASFIRLKTAAFSYTLSKDWVHHLGLLAASIYVEGQNLLTITKYQGYDPETQGKNLPPLRMMTLGVHASF